jgi:hypothetical protein
MIWDDIGFKDAYRAKLKHAHTSSDVEVQAQARAFQAEAARAGGSAPEHFLQRAGAAAAATLSGYVKEALEAFDCVIASLEADLEESDLNALRESLEQEIALRTKALPASLRDFSRPAAHPALLRTILQQAPVKARQLLAERVATSRDRIHTRVRSREMLDRAILIGHDAGDSAVAGALKLAVMQAVGTDAPLYTSSELEGIRTGRDGFERVLDQLKKNRMTLTIVTPRSGGNPWLWWAAGVSAGLGKPVFVLRANGMGADSTLPINHAQDIDLAQRDDVVRLLQAIQGELRRRAKDPSEMDLEDVLMKSLPIR